MNKPTNLATLSLLEAKALLDSGQVSSVELVQALLSWGDQTPGPARTARTAQTAGKTTQAPSHKTLKDQINGFTVRDDASALRNASILDGERAKGQIRGPLHGLPITIKDSMNAVGLPTTLGLHKRRYHRATEDAVVVRAARSLGSIILGKSNVPQMLGSGMECDNPVFGRTVNPWSPEHGPGGSTGGEAALVASGQSFAGFGSDLGGSIRSPAIYCGVVGFKPTTHRWSNLGLVKALDGQDFVTSQTGPLTRTVADAAFLFETICRFDQGKYDAKVPPFLPRDDSKRMTGGQSLKGLTIGYYEHDGYFAPSRSIIRALRLARNSLVAAGAKVVDFAPTNQQAMLRMYLAAISSDGLDVLRGQLTGETIAEFLTTAWRAGHVPDWVRKPLSSVLNLVGESRTAKMLSATGRKSVADYWSLNNERELFARNEMDDWARAGIDAVLCPGSATPAVPIGQSSNFAQVFAYTARYNVLGNPAGVLPVTRVLREDLTPRPRVDRLDRLAADIERQSLGLPVGVQVVGKPWQDHQTLQVMSVIEAAARSQKSFPATPITFFEQPGPQLLGDHVQLN